MKRMLGATSQQTKEAWMFTKTFAAAVVVVTLILSALSDTRVRAHDPAEHPTLVGWAEVQQVMPNAKARHGCASPTDNCLCCKGSEIVKSKFRPIKGVTFDDDGWEWLNIRTEKWEQIENDIIHWGEPTPDGLAVAFEWPIGSGKLRCFFPPQELPPKSPL